MAASKLDGSYSVPLSTAFKKAEETTILEISVELLGCSLL